ncbi:hypothetical protein FOZ61_005844 [Perkinsus olseni]|uniref:RING-type domain-containing protein n=1 Tax=Perkinsus olseni TaxID=32597 RepID=A0A7J6LFR2_PEROL|nr:hypothetical protein FOZ61_005844 [Perkinsus olseni]
MASALSTCGWALGMAMFTIFGALALFSLMLLNAICMRLPDSELSFFAACDAAGLPHLRWVIDCILILNNLGFNVVYLQVSSTLIGLLLDHWSSGSLAYSGAGYRFIVLSVVLLLLLPICLMRHITGTTVANLAGILGFIYVVGAGVSYVILHVESQTSHSLWPTGGGLRVLGVLPVFIFAFAGHFNAFLVAQDLRERSVQRLNLVAFLTIGFTMMLFIPAMCVPYAILSGEVKENFYENLSIENVAVHIGHVILPCAILSAYPLLLLPARASMINLIGMIRPDWKDTRTVHIVTTIGFMLITLVLASTIDSLGSTMALIGLLGADTMTFVAPSYLYLKIFSRATERTWTLAGGDLAGEAVEKATNVTCMGFFNIFKCGSKKDKKAPDTAPSTPTPSSEPLVCGTCSYAQSVPASATAFVCSSCHAVNRIDRSQPEGTMVQTASQAPPTGAEVPLVRLSSANFIPTSEVTQLPPPSDPNEKPWEIPPCSVCLENPGDMVILPCGHGGICEPCAMHIACNEAVGGAHCPKCRGEIEKLLRITRLPNSDAITAVEVPLPKPSQKRKSPPKVPPPPGEKKDKGHHPEVVANAA